MILSILCTACHALITCQAISPDPATSYPSSDLSLFTTMRYTNTSSSLSQGVVKDDIPLWPYHLQRLQEAHNHFMKRDGENKWGTWPGDEVVWEQVREKLDTTQTGDWRVSHNGTLHVSSQADARRFDYCYILTPRLKSRRFQLHPMLVSDNSTHYRRVQSRTSSMC